jgi:hypothetical protein
MCAVFRARARGRSGARRTSDSSVTKNFSSAASEVLFARTTVRDVVRGEYAVAPSLDPLDLIRSFSFL